MKIKRSEEIENRSEREKRVQNPGMKYHGFVLHQNPGTENSGKDRGSVAHRDAEARSRPRTTAESLTFSPCKWFIEHYRLCEKGPAKSKKLFIFCLPNKRPPRPKPCLKTASIRWFHGRKVPTLWQKPEQYKLPRLQTRRCVL